MLLRLLSMLLCSLWVSACTTGPHVVRHVGPIERYAEQTGQLPPNIRAVLAPWFQGHEDVLTRLKVHVLSEFEADATLTLGMPAITVPGSTWVVIPGVLDADGYVRGRLFSWTQPRGIALWGHEAWHVKQFLEAPLLFVYEAVVGICRSLIAGEFYDHDEFPYETEAIVFELHIRAALEAQ